MSLSGLKPSLRRHALRVWRILLALLASSTTVAVGYSTWYGPNERENWPALPSATLFWLTFSLGVAGFLDAGRDLQAERRDTSQYVLRMRVQRIQAGLLVDLAAITKVKITDLGVSVFSSRALIGERIVRVSRYRLDEAPQATRVRWTRGKGAVGQCWDTGRPVHRDWRPNLQEYSHVELTREDFERIPEDGRDGFTYEEFRAMAAKYREVLAHPILSEAGEMLGVISVDLTGSTTRSSLVLKMNGVAGRVAGAAVMLADDVARLDELE